MGIFSSKELLSEAEQERVVAAIRESELLTTGEIRVFIESKCAYVDAVARAREVFYSLKMEQTACRNAVLLYLATTSKQFAIYGDEAAFNTFGTDYFKHSAQTLKEFLAQKKYAESIAACVRSIGMQLQTHFPFDPDVHKNELPDEIVFGH